MTRRLPVARSFCGAVSLIVFLLVNTPNPSVAADGEPIAIRAWPDGRVHIENHWGLCVVLSAGDAADKTPDPSVQKHVTLGTGIDHVWSRRPNQDAATWNPVSDSRLPAGSIRVTSLLAANQIACGWLVRTDGVGLAVLTEPNARGFAAANDTASTDAVPSIDAVVLPSPTADRIAGTAATTWIKTVQPRFVLIPSGSATDGAERFAKQIDTLGDITEIDHNTFAIAQSSEPGQVTRLVTLETEPVQLSGELDALMKKMEASCKRSQAVFSRLSANQLNFRPANGTHTPRWNAEHMMGRQLLFFSQIYHALDPAIPVMDLNPRQMPPDYVAAHPDWGGQEEARQMQRVSDFTRRFAYLLRDINLDTRAPGSRWTLRGLLRQMERHYDDHTANTKKKFQLADWPSE
ncbi:DinB family protein [Stieleria mannarensis]|uniref:DinB family protein n=1 Tax=Stieleria mannarensis TaxID=2755585 RepID=UPI001604549C|nr:DinB family protein [Rhodopirellula sp. JC639]